MLNRAKDAQLWRQVKQVMWGAITDLEQKRCQMSLFVMGVCIPLALCGAQKGLFSIGNGGGHYRSPALSCLINKQLARKTRNKWSIINR